MGFLFPLFLLAGLVLIVPVLIHLFNLRRYKRVSFPDTRFLRNIQLSTKRQSQLRDRRLLATRLLFLAALVLAFAQPFLQGKNRETRAAMTAIYIDNSYSMTMGAGQESLLQQARNKARQLVTASGKEARFLVLTNDRLSATRPMMREEALQALADIRPAAKSISLKQLMSAVTTAQENEKSERWDLYLFTDLQQSTLAGKGDKIPQPSRTAVYLYPLQAPKASNLYIDTAYFLSPALDTRQPNPVVVRVRQSGAATGRSSNLQLSVGGQVRAVSAIETGEGDTAWTDTLALQLSGSGWQDITLALQDHPLSFDDTFRIAARTAPDLSVLVVTENTISPYLQAAFRTYEGFRVQQESAGAVHKERWPQFSLIILQNISAITPELQDAVKEALQRGQNVLLFPDAITNTERFSQAMAAWGAISLGREDTARQQVVSLQQAHPLLQDVFEKVPDNMQLPVTVKRYPVDAALTANQQSLMSFRDGRPFLAQYSLYQGRLYLCAASLDDRSSNFAVSYFFVPLLYKMAVQSGGSNIYAVEIGSTRPLWLPVAGSDDRKVWHLSRNGFDAIPSQRPSGIGVELFLNNAAKEPGFYLLHQEASADSVHVGLNAARSESALDYMSRSELEQLMRPAAVRWLDERTIGTAGWNNAGTSFPLWKIAVILALLGLAGETFLLLQKRKPGPPKGHAVAA